MSWRDDASELVKDKQSKGRLKLAEGENEIRILPTMLTKKSKEPKVYLVYYAHPDVGPKKRFLRCGKDAKGQGDCWLCDVKIPKLEESDSKTDRKRASAMAPKEQMVFQVARYDGDTEELRGPLLYAASTGGPGSIAIRLLKVVRNPKRKVEDLLKGYNITIERTGSGMQTRYSDPVIADDPSKVPSKISEKMKTFSELVPKYDEDGQKAAYFGREKAADEDADTEEEEDERPSKKKKSSEDEEEEEAPKKKKKSRDEDEEEEESDSEEAPDDDDTEEEEAPKKKKKKPADEDEEEEELEEEDEAPKKKKRKAADEDEEEPEEEEEEEAPKKKKKKASADDDDTEEEESEEPKVDEEEEDEPKKKKKKPSRDEEEESEVEEDEEEDESPKKKKKKPRDEEEEDVELDVEEDEEEEEPAPKKKKVKR